MTVMAKKNTSQKSIRANADGDDEASIVQEIRDEFLREKGPRIDRLARLTGRFNRRRGRRVMIEVLAAAKMQGGKDVNALLDRRAST